MRSRGDGALTRPDEGGSRFEATTTDAEGYGVGGFRHPYVAFHASDSSPPLSSLLPPLAPSPSSPALYCIQEFQVNSRWKVATPFTVARLRYILKPAFPESGYRRLNSLLRRRNCDSAAESGRSAGQSASGLGSLGLL